MAVLTQDSIQGGHWYRVDGVPAHRMRNTDGLGFRSTTLRDAKRIGLFPSVTSILNILGKPGLEKWKLDQVALASLRTAKGDNESESYWCRRVRNAAFRQVDEASDKGTRIHSALESAMVGEAFDEALRIYVEPVMTWKEKTGIEIVEREIRIVNRIHGFAGTADVLFRYGDNGIGILDYKTRKTRPGRKVVAYSNQSMQLAAYAATYWGEENIDRVVAANVFLSSTEPGRMEVVKHESLAHDWVAFKLVASLWRYLNDYDPRRSDGSA